MPISWDTIAHYVRCPKPECGAVAEAWIENDTLYFRCGDITHHELTDAETATLRAHIEREEARHAT